MHFTLYYIIFKLYFIQKQGSMQKDMKKNTYERAFLPNPNLGVKKGFQKFEGISGTNDGAFMTFKRSVQIGKTIFFSGR